MDTGDWRRPRTYSSPTDEVRGVRERVGLIDVGTLGKLEVQGKDAVTLLEKVYTISRRLNESSVRASAAAALAGAISLAGEIDRAESLIQESFRNSAQYASSIEN